MCVGPAAGCACCRSCCVSLSPTCAGGPAHLHCGSPLGSPTLSPSWSSITLVRLLLLYCSSSCCRPYRSGAAMFASRGLTKMLWEERRPSKGLGSNAAATPIIFSPCRQPS
ncbi:unnamed protein product [Ectocarpus sp. 8 AP-2014]